MSLPGGLALPCLVSYFARMNFTQLLNPRFCLRATGLRSHESARSAGPVMGTRNTVIAILATGPREKSGMGCNTVVATWRRRS